MATSLGDLSFGLGANTQGLQKSVDLLAQFGRQIDQVAASQVAGAQKTAAAMAQQESAVKRALQQVLNLNAAISRAGAPPHLLAQNTKFFQTYTQQLTSGTLSSVDFGRAQDRMSAQLGKTRRAFQDFRADRANKEVGRFTEVLRDLQSASVLAVGPLSGLGARINALAAITSRSTLVIAGFLGGLTLAGLGLYTLSNAAIQSRKEMDAIMSTLNAASGSATAAAKEFKFVSDVSTRLGLNIRQSAEEYAKFSAAAIGTKAAGEGVQTAFKGVASAATALHLPAQKVTSIIFALQQMLSRGTVRSQEMNLQLGQALPGGMQHAAAAIGKTTAELQKMMEQGTLPAYEFIVKFGDYLQKQFGEAALKASNNLQASLNKLDNAQLKFSRSLDETIGISKGYQATIDAIAGSINFLADNMDQAVGVLGAFAFGIAGLFAPQIISGLGLLIGVFTRLWQTILALNVAILSNPLTALASLFARLAVVIGSAVIGYELFAGATDKVTKGQKELVDDVDQFIKAHEKFQTANKQTTNIIIDEVERRISAYSIELEALQIIARSQEDRARKEREMLKSSGSAAGPGLLLSRVIDSIFGTSQKDVKPQIDDITKSLEELYKRLEKLAKLRAAGVTGEPATSSAAADSVLKRVRQMAAEYEFLQQALSKIEEGSDVVRVLRDAGDAAKLLVDLPGADQAKVVSVLNSLGFAGNTAQEALTGLINKFRLTNEEVEKFISKASRTPEKLAELTNQVKQLDLEIEALSKGPKAFEEYQKQLERFTAIETFRKTLESTTVTTDEFLSRMDEFISKLDLRENYRVINDRWKSIIDNITGGFDRAFDRIGSIITESFLKGEKAVITFGNIAMAVLSEVLQTAIEIALIAPLKDATSSFLNSYLSTSTGGSSFSDYGYNPYGSLYQGAHGRVLSKGKFTPFARGTVLNGPIVFPMANGATGMAGERSEGILPLFRGPSGDLGVKSSGGDGPRIIINVHNYGDDKASAKTSKTAGGDIQIDVLIDKITAGNIRKGGLTALALESRYGSSPARAGR